MERAPGGTSVGVDDPYEHGGRCDHVTDDGRCRLAIERPEAVPEFARKRGREGYMCPVVAPLADDPSASADWASCPHYRDTSRDEECARCGLVERRVAHGDDRPLLEAHHISYEGEEELTHEITVSLCRWCHASIHRSWARLDDDVNPDPEALAAAEGRRSRELSEAGFETARERFADE